MKTPCTRDRSRRRAVHLISTALLVSILGLSTLVGSPTATAAPREIGDLPASLQQYVPGSASWDSSPWMTSPACTGKGGDFSVWAANVVADIPRFVPVFLADLVSPTGAEQDRLRGLEITKGFRDLSIEFRDQVPAGYCVDDVKRWAGADPQYKPFGFTWGVTHRTPYLCVDDGKSGRNADLDNRWVGAERAGCDGFFVACDTADGDDRGRCDAWDAFSVRFTQRGKEFRDAAISRYPARGVATYHTEVAWHWVILISVSGAVTLAGWWVLVIRRRRGDATDGAGGNDVTA